MWTLVMSSIISPFVSELTAWTPMNRYQYRANGAEVGQQGAFPTWGATPFDSAKLFDPAHSVA